MRKSITSQRSHDPSRIVSYETIWLSTARHIQRIFLHICLAMEYLFSNCIISTEASYYYVVMALLKKMGNFFPRPLLCREGLFSPTLVPTRACRNRKLLSIAWPSPARSWDRFERLSSCGFRLTIFAVARFGQKPVRLRNKLTLFLGHHTFTPALGFSRNSNSCDPELPKVEVKVNKWQVF